ncbi:MAG: TonB-dependent receptor [Oligoflexia bacterium]|nr:TonB-dependent receptor [Oligoflexia bacterium]
MRKILFIILILNNSAIANAEDALVLETIKVKGTKEEKSYFENTESISILKENEVTVSGRASDLQVLTAVPNVEVNKNGESFSIRGINNTGVTGYQKDNLASIVVDDLFQTDLAIKAGSFDLWDIEQIEILRGAQSTNLGVNSLAGSVLLSHRRPVFFSSGQAKLGLGSFWNREAGAVANTVLWKDKVAARISLNKEMSDGYITNVTKDNKEWGGWDRNKVALSALYKISDLSELDMTAKFHQNDQGGTYVQGTDAFRNEVREDSDYKNKTTNYQFITKYKYTLSDQVKLSSILGFSRSRQDLSSDADGTAQNTAGTRLENHNDHYLSVENRIQYKSEKVENLLGIHAHDFRLKEDYAFNLLFPLGSSGASTPVAVTQYVDRKRRAYSVFDSLTFHLNQNNSLLAGVRGEYVLADYHANITGRRLQNLGGANTTVDNYIAGIVGGYGGKKTNFTVLPKAGYLWRHDAHRIGLTYTRAYRTAGISINRRRATIVQYDPEYTNNFELSYKYAGEDFHLSSNLFYIDWRRQQVQVQLSSDFYDSEVKNAAKSMVYGAEIEAKYKFTAKQTFSLGIGYSDTEFKDFITRSANYKGKEFPFASHWTGRLAHEIRPHEKVQLFTTARYVSKSWANAENTRRSGSQIYLDLNAKIALHDQWLLETYANNSLNRRFLIFDGTPTSTTSPYQASYHQVSAPRELGMRINYYW